MSNGKGFFYIFGTLDGDDIFVKNDEGEEINLTQAIKERFGKEVPNPIPYDDIPLANVILKEFLGYETFDIP
jgi:hypothetical protein